jgi:uncharacterized protein DUF4129
MTGQPTRGWWPLLAVTLLLVLAGATSAVATPQLTHIPVPNSTPQPGPEGPSDGPTPIDPSPVPAQGRQAAGPAVPGWVLPLLGGVLLAVVVGGLLTVLWVMARGRMRSRIGQLGDPAAPPVGAAEQVVAVLDAGLSDLSDTDLDPRRAVIACWVRLEQVAAAAGTPRQVADTPTDLVTRLLAAHCAVPHPAAAPIGVDPGVLAAFAEIYRRARYATHGVDEQMRGQARTALERIRSELTPVAA